MEIASQTSKDKILSQVCTYMQHNSQPFSIPEEIAPFHMKKEELTYPVRWVSAVGKTSDSAIKASAPIIG